MKYQIVNHENVGERSMPHAIAPCDKGIEEALEIIAGNIDVYAEHKEELMDIIPDGLPCKLTNRKNPVDYMDFSILQIAFGVIQNLLLIIAKGPLESQFTQFHYRISLEPYKTGLNHLKML